jgi:hypothetical protein
MKLVKSCSQCGNENPDNAKFCEYCGNNLISSKRESNQVGNTTGVLDGLTEWWNQQNNRTKTIIGIVGVCCLGLILIVGIGGMMSPDKTTTTQPTTTTTQPPTTTTQPNTTTTQASIPMIKVSSTGPWSGNIDDSTGSKTVDGSGSQTIQLSQDPGIVSVTFQKDNSKDVINNGTIVPDTSTLTVQIVDGSGNVVATQSTSADAGVVSVSHTF